MGCVWCLATPNTASSAWRGVELRMPTDALRMERNEPNQSSRSEPGKASRHRLGWRNDDVLSSRQTRQCFCALINGLGLCDPGFP